MAVLDQVVTGRYALYNGDCCEVLPTLPTASVDLSVYSPPFGGLYHYSSSDRDLSNARSYEEFLAHYEFVVSEMARVTKPGRMTAVHCMDVVLGGKLVDLPGDIIRLHEKHGFRFFDRKMIWKDPLKEAYRTRALALRHNQLLKDSIVCRSALPDYVVVLEREGTNKVPIAHPVGLMEYAGELDPAKRERLGYAPLPEDLLRIGREWDGDPNKNPLSHWIFRRYASPLWGDLRTRVLKYKAARESEEEKHVHPSWLDVVERACTLWSNPTDTVLTPFMGVGTEVYVPVRRGGNGIGIELKSSFYRQAVLNVAEALEPSRDPGALPFEFDADEAEEEACAS